MQTAQQTIEALAEKFAMSEINNMDFAIYKRTTDSTKITVDFLNEFMTTRLKYPDYSRKAIALQMIHDYPEFSAIIYKKVDDAGQGLPIDERENVKAYCESNINDRSKGRKFLSDRLSDITHLSLVDVITMDQARWHITRGQMGKRVDSVLKRRYLAFIKRNGSH